MAQPTIPRIDVCLYVDPSCPFAWITSRWLHEVSRHRPIGLEPRLMSLSVLNEGRSLEPWYREFNDRAWGPARVAAGVERDHGPAAFAAFYTAYGTRVHTDRSDDRSLAISHALDSAGLPAALAELVGDTTLDPRLRRSQAHVNSTRRRRPRHTGHPDRRRRLLRTRLQRHPARRPGHGAVRRGPSRRRLPRLHRTQTRTRRPPPLRRIAPLAQACSACSGWLGW
jgi:hypothetical protein